MKKRKIWIVALILTGGLLGCGKGTEVPSWRPEAVACGFTEVWQEKWEVVNGSPDGGMLLGDGKAFLADLDGDNVPEIFFLYDNWRSSRGVVYAIDGESVRELGEFDAASFYNQDLSFELYQGEEGAILHTQSVLETGVADPREPVTDYYLSLQDGKLTVQEISWIRSKDGDFLEEEDVRSQEEREKETTKILQGRSLAQTILLPKEEIIEDFTDSAVLENTMMALLQDWERET